MICNEKIVLRAPEPQDVDAMFRWENDRTSWPDGRTRCPMSRHALWQYVENYSADILAAGQARFIIVDRSTSEPLGCIDLYDIDPVNRRAGVGVYVESASRGQGIASMAIGLMADYCRVDLGLHQLWAIMATDNQSSRSLFSRCAFKECGRLRSWIRQAEHYTDALIAQRLLTE